MHVAKIILLNCNLSIQILYCCFWSQRWIQHSLDQYMLIFELRKQNKRVATSSRIGLIYVLTKIRSQYERKIRELSSYVQ